MNTKKNSGMGTRNNHTIYIGSCLAILILLLMLTTPSVHALGIAPSREVIDYDTNARTFEARVINNEHKEMKIILYAQGELAAYVHIPTTTLRIASTSEEQSFSYTVELPPGLQPGTKNLDIVVMEVPIDMNVDIEKTIIVSTVNVIHQLRVNVPYPGTFAEGAIYVSEANSNETAIFTANIVNRGTSGIRKIDGEIVIKGPTNEELYRKKSTVITDLPPQQAEKIQAEWMADTNPGVYYAEFIVNYDGKQMVLRKTFMVGNYQIDVKELSVKDFKLGTIAKFDIDLVNTWNEPITDVYADVMIRDDQGTLIGSTKTITTTVPSLTTSTIYAYWDTEGINAGTYDVQTILHYNTKISEKTFKAVVGIDAITVQTLGATGNIVTSDGKGNSNSILTILVIILVVINVGWFIYFKFLKKKKEDRP